MFWGSFPNRKWVNNVKYRKILFMSANGEITVAIGGRSNTFNGVIMQVIKYNFPMYGDERGQLVVLEEFKDIPFKIKRVYYIYNLSSR